MKKIICAVPLALTLLGGCATSSGILPMGKDLYSLTVQADAASSAKKNAIEQAAEHCSKKGQSIEVAKTGASSDAYGWHSYEVTFRCTN